MRNITALWKWLAPLSMSAAASVYSLDISWGQSAPGCVPGDEGDGWEEGTRSSYQQHNTLCSSALWSKDHLWTPLPVVFAGARWAMGGGRGLVWGWGLPPGSERWTSEIRPSTRGRVTNSFETRGNAWTTDRENFPMSECFYFTHHPTPYAVMLLCFCVSARADAHEIAWMSAWRSSTINRETYAWISLSAVIFGRCVWERKK